MVLGTHRAINQGDVEEVGQAPTGCKLPIDDPGVHSVNDDGRRKIRIRDRITVVPHPVSIAVRRFSRIVGEGILRIGNTIAIRIGIGIGHRGVPVKGTAIVSEREQIQGSVAIHVGKVNLSGMVWIHTAICPGLSVIARAVIDINVGK